MKNLILTVALVAAIAGVSSVAFSESCGGCTKPKAEAEAGKGGCKKSSCDKDKGSCDKGACPEKKEGQAEGQQPPAEPEAKEGAPL